VRKIISILMTLGLVLGLVVIAAPTSAAIVCVADAEADVSLSTPCACQESVYNITWNTSASLTEGFNSVCVEFPEGTGLPDEFDDGDILISVDGGPVYEVHEEEVTIDGTTVCFLVPAHLDAGEVLVQFIENVDNTCTPGWTELYVWTDRAPDSEPVMGEFKIWPQYAEYEFTYDFSPTYPGIAYDFIPPFRACGQNDSARANWTPAYNTTEIADVGFVTNFTLFFDPTTDACLPPCAEADIWFEVVNIPDDEEVYLVLNGTAYTLDICNITKTVADFDTSTDILLKSDYVLEADTSLNWTGALHFSSPGKDYEFGFYYECPITCCGGGIVGRSDVFEVHQDKEAYKLTLCEKWNLVSLPLVPLVDPPTVEEYLASANIPAFGVDGGFFAGVVISGMWHYDAFTGEWLHWAPGAADNTLTELEDGKAYWVYVNYPLDEAIDNFLSAAFGGDYTGTAAYAFSFTPADDCCEEIVWWIWGTEKPVPPAAPSQYPVAEGWNMLGFTSVFGMAPIDYLWNWNSTVDPVTYGYTDNCWNLQTWDLIDFTGGTMVPGEGYFVAFPKAGTVYVP
jgi:hypothetical protein